MKNLKTIHDYLPKKETETVLVQAKIGKELHTIVKEMMDQDGITWQDLLVASLKRYIDERKAS